MSRVRDHAGSARGKHEADPYGRYASLLASALAALAREGFVVPAQDALDVMRDFFAEEWLKVRASYDPAHASKARFETYLYSAFLRFARKRIVRLRRWYGRLSDIVEIRELVAEGTDVRESERDLARVRDAIDLLPEAQRGVLLDYLSLDATSERALARSRGMNRYHLRETLVEALGGVAVRIGEKGSIPKADWDVALSLWRDGRDLRQTATYLERSVPDVQASRRRIFELLAAPASLTSRKERKERVLMDTTLASLIDKAISNVGDESLLIELRRHADALGRALSEAESDDAPLDQLGAALTRFEEKLGPDSEWVARVLGALSDRPTELTPELREELLLIDTREREVAEAFDLLVSDLPPDFHLPKRLAHLKAVPAHLQQMIREQPFMENAGKVALALSEFGMSPLTVFSAARAVPELAERIVRFETAPGLDPFLLRLPGSQVAAKVTLDPQIYVDEIHEVASCSREMAAVLYGWLFDVSSIRRHAFFGYEASHAKELVRLAPLKDRTLNVLQAWASV